MKSQQNNRGYVAIDALIALGIVVVLAIALTTAVHRQRLAEAGLADSRAAVHLAEHALLNLQHHQPIPSTGHDAQLKLLPVAAADVPAGFKWLEVQATVRGHERSLIGIIPDGGTP